MRPKKARAAKKAPAKKKSPAKKMTAAKKKASAKKAPVKAAATKKAAATTPVPTAATVTGQITSWDPSSGRGTVKTATQEMPFDLTKTELVNEGYVDLHVGRPVKVAPMAQQPEVQSLEAL